MSSLNLTISEILLIDAISIAWKGNVSVPDGNIRQISTDSRSLEAGDVFVAIEGERFNGHDFVKQAVEAKVSACVVSEKWYSMNSGAFENSGFLVVQDTLEAYQEIARFYRMKFDIPVVAITGSSGKTTTKEFVASVLSQKYNVLSNIKSFNNHIGVPATLLNLRPEHEILVTELGTNHFGELDRLSYLVEPSVCLFTNIGYAHLEFFKDKQGVARAKMEMLNSMQANGLIIYNADDPILADVTFPSENLVSFGTSQGADVSGQILYCDALAKYRFDFSGTLVQLSVPGSHNVSNALAATAVAKHFNVENQKIKDGIESFNFVEKRMHVVEHGSIRIIDDTYNSNPGSCMAAIDTLKDIKTGLNGRRIAILADMKELGQFSIDEHVNIFKYAGSKEIDALFLFGSEMEKAFELVDKHCFDFLGHFQDKSGLFDTLKQYVASQDVLLVKGSRSMHMEEIVENLKSIEEM